MLFEHSLLPTLRKGSCALRTTETRSARKASPCQTENCSVEDAIRLEHAVLPILRNGSCALRTTETRSARKASPCQTENCSVEDAIYMYCWNTLFSPFSD